MKEEKMFMPLAFLPELCLILEIFRFSCMAQVHLFNTHKPKLLVENLQDFNSQQRWRTTVSEKEANCPALWHLMKGHI